MSGGGSDVEWGNGQPGNQQYDPGYGTAAQKPTAYLAAAPGGFLAGGSPEGPSASTNGFSPGEGGGGGGGYSPGTALNPTTAGGSGTGLPGVGSFDTSNFSPGINFGNVMSFNPAESGFGGGDNSGYGGGGAPITDLAGAAAPGAGGFDSVGGSGNLASFAPGGGINIPSDFPDPTSGAAGTGTADGSTDGTTFGNRFGAANDAIRSGEFDPVGPNYYNPDTTNGPPLPSGITPTNLGGAAPSGGESQPLTALAYNGQQPEGLSQAGPATADTFTYNQPTISNPGTTPGVTSSSPGVTAPSGGGSSPSGGSALDKLAAGAMNSVTKNPLGIAVAAGGLGLNLLKGNQDPEGLAQIRDAANSLKSTGSVLQSYLQTGTLPPGMQASVDQATKSAKARIIANYASRGLSTNPAHNSALGQELSQLDQNAIITAATLGDKLMSQGLSATQISQQLYTAIMNNDIARSKATGSAIANFAAALGGGGGGGTTIKLGA